MEVFVVPYPNIIIDQLPSCLNGDVASSNMRCESHICVMWSLCTCSHILRENAGDVTASSSILWHIEAVTTSLTRLHFEIGQLDALVVS